MTTIVSDCPRCSSNRITLDVKGANFISQHYGWQQTYEIFCVCRECKKSTVFIIKLKTDFSKFKDEFNSSEKIINFGNSLTKYFVVDRFINLKDNLSIDTPDSLPEDIVTAFEEASSCKSVGCPNASATMLRLCLDLATRPMLPDPDDKSIDQPNSRQRRDLGLRLPWLFENGTIPKDLEALADCVKQDGNEGAHQGTITKDDLEDLVDFTISLLERLFTEPAKLAKAQERRQQRRAVEAKPT